MGDTNKSNFRYQIATIQPYKGSRKDQKRPEHEVALRNYLFKYHSGIEVQDCETDDALGIEQMATYQNYLYLANPGDPDDFWNDTIICTNDKDLDMIPGWHYDLDFGKTRKKKDGVRYKLKAHKTKQMYFISDPGWIDLRRNEENGKQVLCGGGYLWFCCQLLLGDKTDDIPSLSRGYGPVKVYGVLKDCQTEKEGIHAVYKEYCAALKDSLTIDQTQARLMEIAQLVWIKRSLHDDVIFKRSWLDE